ncbi:hypothetical protein [Actinacidiphila soli]|uniref:hypothetical protein n=1 Tax=Actinacidiphila soli TaxID=2487275 RepID=UPI000FCADCDB|nr:hypothetical protein [Actinacidiphila soli]
MEQKRKIAAALTATAVMTVMGAGGAAAQAQPEAGKAARLVHAQSNPVRPHRCYDIDSAGNEFRHAKYVSAVCDGRVYVLSVNESTAPPTPVGGWQFVGGPSNVVDATLASNVFDVGGGPVLVTALTSKGNVWEGVCANTLPLGPCTFTQLPKPPQ